MLVSGFEHVQIAIPKGEEARACTFYGALPGFTEVAKPAALATRGGLWFVVEKPLRPARKAHIALLVQDTTQARAAPVAAGVAVTDEDPFGSRLEFVAESDRGFTTGAAG